MLHEEVAVDWTSLQRQVQEPKLLEVLQMDFVPGVRLSSVVRSSLNLCF
jgi:hypothetical protein